MLFLEFPLAGEAGFDLHICHDGGGIRRGAPFPDEIYGGHGRLFSWFGSEDRGADAFIADFFGYCGAAEAAAWFAEKRALLPGGWTVWYTGVHTGRRGKPLRIGCVLSKELQESYAKNIGAFEEALSAVGFPVPLSPAMREKLRELFRFPFLADIQIDVMEDGSVGDTLGVSLTTGGVRQKALAASFAGGDMWDLMRILEEWGVADCRWKLIPAATFQMYQWLRSREGERHPFILSGRLGFVKVRFRGGGPLAFDAKGYISLRAIPQA